MDKLHKDRHQMVIEEVYKIRERFSLNSCFPHIFPLRLVCKHFFFDSVSLLLVAHKIILIINNVIINNNMHLLCLL